MRRTRLRVGAFDPGSQTVELSIFLGLFSLTGGFERFGGFAPSYGQGASLRLRALRPHWTSSTGGVGELDFDDVLTSCVSGRPTAAGLALRAIRLFVVPIQREVAERIARLLAGRPSMILAGGAHQIDAILRLAGNQQFGSNISRIDKMLLREQVVQGSRPRE